MLSESYVLSNPLSGGELVLVGITGVIGYGLADFVGRYMQTTPVAAGGVANSIPAGQTVGNDVATMVFPSWQSLAAQLGVAAVPGIAAAFVDSPWGRAALQGMMLGAGLSLFGGVFKSLMANMLSQNPLGQQLYLAEIEAQAAVTAAGGSVSAASATAAAPGAMPVTSAPPVTAAPTGMQGLPVGVGARPMLRDPGPVARGMGQQPSATWLPPAAAPPFIRQPGLVMQQGQPPYSPGGPGNPPPPLPGGSTPPPIRQPGIPAQHNFPTPPGTLTNTGDVVATPAPGTPTPGGPSTGPMCAPCTSTNGGIAATHQSAMDAIRDESCLGALPVGFGMYHSFPNEDAA